MEKNEEERIIHIRYSELSMTHKEREIVYDCYMTGVNHDGHVWIRWVDIEKMIIELKEQNDGI